MPAPPARTRVLDRIFELVVLMQHDMTESLARLGLTPSRTNLLWVLSRTGPCSQRVLAEEMDVSPRNVTGLVDALVGTGFVSREPHPTDRRATLVTLTEHGARVMKQMHADHEELGEVLLGHLTPARLAELGDALDGAVERLRTRLAEEAGDA